MRFSADLTKKSFRLEIMGQKMISSVLYSESVLFFQSNHGFQKIRTINLFHLFDFLFSFYEFKKRQEYTTIELNFFGLDLTAFVVK